MSADRQTSPRLVAFVRAINAGAANRITMPRLAALFEAAGCTAVTWHIQTGNIFFAPPGEQDRERVAVDIERALAGAGLTTNQVMIRTAAQLRALVGAQPFDGLDPLQWSCEVTFLRQPAQIDVDSLRSRGFTIPAADALSCCVASPRGSRLTGGANRFIERQTGSPATSRGWAVVQRVEQIAAGPPG